MHIILCSFDRIKAKPVNLPHLIYNDYIPYKPKASCGD